MSESKSTSSQVQLPEVSSKSRSSGMNRVLVKLETALTNENFYEAHQLYRTLCFRLTAQKKYEECLDLLYDGALKLAAKQQESSAADIGLLVIDTLEKQGNCNNSEMWMQRIAQLLNCFSPSTVEKETLINRAIKWSGDISGNRLGHPLMHKFIVDIFMKDNNIENARHHVLLCGDGKFCGLFIMNISQSMGYPNEKDIFIVQAVLQQLCLNDSKTAEETFNVYTKNHPQISKKDPPYDLPLLNFLYLLFRCIEIRRLEAFLALMGIYKASLDRDPSFAKYLSKIGILYFNAQPPTTGGGGFMGNMFGDFFSRLFQDMNEEEEDVTPNRTTRIGPAAHELD